MPAHYLGSLRLTPKEIARMRRREWPVARVLVGVAVGAIRIPRLFIPLFFALAVSLSAGTSASFTDDTLFPTQSVGAGAWIPDLTIVTAPDAGAGGTYEEAPCVTFASTVSESIIYYEFSEDGDPKNGGAVYGGGCLILPDVAVITLQAVAVSAENSHWQSDVRTLGLVITQEGEKSSESAKKHKKKEKNDDKDILSEPLATLPVTPLELPLPVEPVVPDSIEETVPAPLVIVPGSIVEEVPVVVADETVVADIMPIVEIPPLASSESEPNVAIEPPVGTE